MISTHRTRIIDAADRLALIASGACIIHCLAMPLLFAALPALSSVLPVSESFQLWMIGFAVPTSAVALFRGGVGRRGWAALWLGIAGLILLTIGAMVVSEGAHETTLTVAGALTLATAHIINWRRRHGSLAS